MMSTKKASEIVAGDKIFTSDSPNKPQLVLASYSLGDNWGIEVKDVRMILQVKPDDTLKVWTN
ncbi:hypothetical protein KITKAT_50 [Arthrobacter phage Kitkat]|uniref:Uncharacterized protein n=3 Tax=Kelleziovirus TaxID=1982236 RepID=A0A140G6D3_9CAUD|nr:hypothetical protein BJD78_gp48 [Arthrobacter phage KellEzio]YP_009303333.1 hypothetical protein BJD77_gp050 [Arthrobacter phage Kitkat]AMM44218.1 hypothetical protein KELLEZIO_48 [Arthrobacter phage KellEzio]AMM44311.1 hypothetical protein KITKAT_50 [Arthrobacter phage Kitkat]QGJ96488.1 hypothetical protein SEA_BEATUSCOMEDENTI_49 [Arthrobacter phage BeatusComedenti]